MTAHALRAALAGFALMAALCGPALAQQFPVTVEHRYGETTVPEQPERVVSLSYHGHDDILALGVTPVAVRHWNGDHPHGVWPWAQEALGDAEPEVLRGEINIERIAALDPDVILAIGSGITEDQYQLLSRIAPAVAPEAQYGDYGTPWQVAARTRAQVLLGQTDRADEMIARLEQRIAETATAHPEWQDMTAAAAFYWDGAPGAYRSIDKGPRFLEALGFNTPDAINDLGAKDDYFVSLSSEDISPLDTDLLLWFDEFAAIENVTLRETLTAHQEGREIFVGDLLTGAFAHSSLLSLDYVLDELVPLIELAVDGDPETVVPNGDVVAASDQ